MHNLIKNDNVWGHNVRWRHHNAPVNVVTTVLRVLHQVKHKSVLTRAVSKSCCLNCSQVNPLERFNFNDFDTMPIFSMMGIVHEPEDERTQDQKLVFNPA